MGNNKNYRIVNRRGTFIVYRIQLEKKHWWWPWSKMVEVEHICYNSLAPAHFTSLEDAVNFIHKLKQNDIIYNENGHQLVDGKVLLTDLSVLHSIEHSYSKEGFVNDEYRLFLQTEKKLSEGLCMIDEVHDKLKYDLIEYVNQSNYRYATMKKDIMLNRIYKLQLPFFDILIAIELNGSYKCQGMFSGCYRTIQR